jgi:UDP-glucose 4-epimerase
VLVTGGAGFIGSHVVDGLVRSGYHVKVLDNLSSGQLDNISLHIRQGSVEFFEGDIRDHGLVEKLVNDVDVVVHLAAVVSVPFSLKNPDFTFDVNVHGTRNLLAFCSKADVKKVIFASSCSVYGSPRYLPVDEVHPIRPLSPYAFSKLEGEHCCEEFIQYSDADMVILRFFNVYGPRQSVSKYSGVITKFIERVENGRPLVIYGDGSQTRDFVQVMDVANAVLTLVRGDCARDVFNIGSGKSVSINDLAKTFLSLSGGDYGIAHKALRDGDIAHSVADTSKARQAFGYVPKVGLEEGLQDLLLYNRSVAQ